MFLKITTACVFIGSDKVHIVEVDDNLSESEIKELVDQYVQDDVEPNGDYDIIEEDEVIAKLEDYGCGLEKR